MKATRFSMILVLIAALPFMGKAQDTTKANKTIGAKMEAFNDFRETTMTQAYNMQLYAGYKTWYAKSDLVVNPSITIGKYYGNSEYAIRYRDFDLDLNAFQYIPVLNYPNNFYAVLRYMRQFESNTNIFIQGIAYERYLNDYNVIQARILQKTGGDRDAWSFHARYYYKKVFAAFAGINQWGHKNVAVVYSLKNGFNFGISYEEQVDYYDFDRLTVSLGYSRKF